MKRLGEYLEADYRVHEAFKVFMANESDETWPTFKTIRDTNRQTMRELFLNATPKEREIMKEYRTQNILGCLKRL